MDADTAVNAVHVLGMFVAVTAFVGSAVLFRLVMRGGDTRAMAGAGPAVNALARVGASPWAWPSCSASWPP